jgi:serine/threonine protein kinase
LRARLLPGAGLSKLSNRRFGKRSLPQRRHANCEKRQNPIQSAVARAHQYLGSYRLLNLVGTGRHCEVWDAMHDALAERRACKLILPQYGKDKEQVALMRQEFTAAKEMRHKNVIRVFEFSVDKEVPFLAMEYFPSVNLKQLILQDREALEPRMPKIIERAALGLGHVHEQGWIHRDIKPDNFLIRADGEVKLIDFALAEKKKTGLSRLFSVRSKVQGTRSYMSPEQIRGKALDERSDIYSFGCTMFEALGGRPPYTGSSTNDLLNKHLRNAPPALEALNRNVTTEFSNLIKKTLAKERDERPQSMTEFLRDMINTRVLKVLPKTGAGERSS